MGESLKNKKILVTGGAGFVGSFLVEKLIKRGVSKKNILIPRSRDLDLRKWENCQKVVRGKDLVIHLAVNGGGIGKNSARPGELFYDNIMMGAQLMEAARQANVKKFVAIGTICVYPKFSPVPFKEENMWLGYPEETNAPYGLAKKMMLVQSQAYRKQYDFNSIYLMPVNLYGPRDNFDPTSSHVIPALIRKVCEAKNKKLDHIEVWGTGKPTREFLYVEDAAEGIIMAAEKYNEHEPVNLGSGMEISIKNLVKTVCQLADYKGGVIWDKTKPDGQPRRMLDVTRAKKEFGFKAKTDFETGLKNTIIWYQENYLK
ncbi:MAG: GDP-fucose synthetase [Candidatus Yanofskybacteria bacterium RIFCSPHIGHO2_01_FULL_44_17]|uniref:GDP-L-fucose synthase n=1 Tax=Candidatus Yanofskybacteria bacterium RIFCSPHIGHO2_01_FULL_44_17 TaxID=1802668 RepID=A0A1F8ETB5_9BACT|nr:MAG: GDP-fucose synthetase [Candidatus Yanofskybacteria bacterium RIFCSPHIGHO2_01_FULL_44_17]